MRQLLMWCGARALGYKPSFEKEDGNARLAGMSPQILSLCTIAYFLASERDTIAASKGLFYEIRIVRLVR